jgi:hypothetical protein
MKKSGMKLVGGVLLMLLIADFTACTSSAQKKIDALMPRQEQAQLLINPGLFEVAGLDGEKMTNYWQAIPGLVPGRHTITFYQGSITTTAGFAGPVSSTTTTVSGNMTVTATSQQTQAYAGFTRSSDLLTLEHDYEAGKAYILVNDAGGKPLIMPVGYTEWYWEWRKASKKTGEAILTVKDEHYRFADGPWLFCFLIDGEFYTYFDLGQKKEMVVPKGRHTLSIIDKKDPLSETVSFSVELDVDTDALELEITGSKNTFNSVVR